MKIRQCIQVCIAIIVLSGCHAATESSFPGYAEGEYVRIASPYAGNLTALNVKRGDQIAAGAPLFALEQTNERAARAEAAARVKQAEARLENLRKGKRSEEVAAVRAQLAQVDASLKLSTAALKRTENLVTNKFLSPAKLDEARSAYEHDRARTAELNAMLQVSKLAGRPDEIAAAVADVSAASEQLVQADWRLNQKSQRAPQAAMVIDTLYTQGEWVQASMPVVSLLPAENIKLKFFVGEKELSALKISQEVTVGCDGCAPLKANITFIAAQAEYTSPIIYSKENRAALVFMIEARTSVADAVKLHPGQPVEIRR